MFPCITLKAVHEFIDSLEVVLRCICKTKESGRELTYYGEVISDTPRGTVLEINSASIKAFIMATGVVNHQSGWCLHREKPRSRPENLRFRRVLCVSCWFSPNVKAVNKKAILLDTMLCRCHDASYPQMPHIVYTVKKWAIANHTFSDDAFASQNH